MTKKHFLILILISLFFGCRQNKADYNTADQKEYINRWYFLLEDYKKSNNNVEKDELIEKCTQLFNEHKSFNNWKGQVKEINSYDDYAQLVIAQMITHNQRSEAEFHVNIYKTSPSYNLIKTLKESDEIVFSGVIDSEISITGNGKITEPELLVNCTTINGVENTTPESNETKSNSSSNNSPDDIIRNKVNQKISNKYFYNDENGLYTVIHFEPVNDGAPLGAMILSQMKCNFSFTYEIDGNKIDTKFLESGCGRTSTDRIFFYNESSDCIYMNLDGQKFIFRENP